MLAAGERWLAQRGKPSTRPPAVRPSSRENRASVARRTTVVLTERGKGTTSRCRPVDDPPPDAGRGERGSGRAALDGSPRSETPRDRAADFWAPEPLVPRLTTGSVQVSSKTGQVHVSGCHCRFESTARCLQLSWPLAEAGRSDSAALGGNGE